MAEQRFAIMDGDKVVNLILWNSDDEYEVLEGHTAVPVADEIGIDWVRSGTEWIQPETVEPLAPPVLVEDPAVTQAKITAMNQLVGLGITEAVARTIVGLPPA